MKERLISGPFVFSFNECDGGPGAGSDGQPVRIPSYVYQRYEVGDTMVSHYAAPGTGQHVQRITRKDDTGIYGVTMQDTGRILTAAEVR